jgi:LysR family glycine cleavage system transcriptional activator
LLDRWARTHRIVLDPKRASIKADNAAAALEITANAGGIIATMSTYAAPYLASGRLVAPFGPGEILPLALHVVPIQHGRMSRSAALFLRWISSEFPMVDGTSMSKQGDENR